ncbi:MAG: hypothetical protein AAF960_04620 [Bacteroidota bacterium]
MNYSKRNVKFEITNPLDCVRASSKSKSLDNQKIRDFNLKVYWYPFPNILSCCILVIFLIVVGACGDGEYLNPRADYDCTFVQNDRTMDGLIDDTEQAIMRSCTRNALTSKMAIEQNLIGEWELVGFGHGWVARTSKPCGYLTVTKSDLTLELKTNDTDTIITQAWKIEGTIWGDKKQFRLNLLGDNYVHEIAMTQFCDEYMFSNFTPSDGNMYLYQKVR